MGHLDPEAKHIISTRVRCGRALKYYPFSPRLSKVEYKAIECKIGTVLRHLEDEEYQGDYHHLPSMSIKTRQQLIDDHYLFKEGDRFLEAANATRFWPHYRGIFYNQDKTFVAWMNEEDHLRLISMQRGGDLPAVYSRLKRAVKEMEMNLDFERHPRLGYLTFCPTNIGTTIRASVHIELPKLAADPERFHTLAKKLNLQIRGTAGEHSETVQGVFDVSNKRRIGLTEFEVVLEMANGIRELIEEEEMCP